MDKNEPSLINNLIQNYHNYKNSNEKTPIENITLNWLKASSCFKGREETLSEINKLFETKQVVVIQGAPGIGKTETARQFAIKYSEYFKGNLIWVYAETKTKIQESFRLLKRSFRFCRLGVTNADVSQLYYVFKNSRCLFIFDNAENMETIRDFLPNSQLHPTVKVLITSQFRDWDLSAGQVSLKALELKDAVDVLRTKLQDEFNKRPNEIWYKVVKPLEGIPLSVQIVSSLLDQEFRTVPIENFYFEGFINELMDQHYINSKFLICEQTLYNKTILLSIYSALNRLKMEEAPHSFDLLCFIAYLDADKINPKELLLVPSINKSRDILKEALNKLNNYSLIQFGKHDYFIKIHRTIQLVSRKYDLNKLNGNMFKATLKIILDDLLFDQMPSVFKYVKTDEFQNKSIEFYSDIGKNENLKDLYFSYLAEYQCDEILRILLPKFKNEFHETDEYNKILNEMLFDAICNKNTDMRTIDVLINFGAKITYSSENNGFHKASSWLSKLLFDHLLESNDYENVINSKDEWGQPILHLLVLHSEKNNTAKIIKCMDHLIFKWNADISIESNDLDNILHTACGHEDICVQMIKYLVEKCNCKNLIICQNKGGETPLQVLFGYNSSNSDFIEIVTYLINECDITIQNNYGWNILFVVCRYGTSKFVEIVLRSKRCREIINIQDKQGDVAFTHLIYNYRIKEDEKIELMKLFIANEMNFKIRNNANKTLAKIANKEKLQQLSDELKKHGLIYSFCIFC